MYLQLKEVQESLTAAKLESCEASERFSAVESSWNEREGSLLEQCRRLEERAEDITRQNSLLHDEADKVCVGGGWPSLLALCPLGLPPLNQPFSSSHLNNLRNCLAWF